MIAVITGASAGIGRAAAREFAARGWDVALIARSSQRLAETLREILDRGVRAIAVPADVADFAAVEAATLRIEAEMGPIDVWVNNAMATLFAPVSATTPEEFRRATEVTYLGQVHGTMVALGVMRPRNQGTIVNIGSALAYRSIPLQAAYCGAKHGVRGFTNALRSELIHDGSDIGLVMVHLPAVNTPQFDWALNKTGRRAQPMPPIFQPEVAARAIFFAATHPDRREIWVGLSTAKAILGNRVASAQLDRYLAKAGYTGQLADDPQPADAASNLFGSVDADYGAHGRFDDVARDRALNPSTSRQPAVPIAAMMLGFAILGLAAGRKAQF